MKLNDLHYQTAIGMLFGVGPKKGKLLEERLPNLEILFSETPKRLAKLTGYSVHFFEQMDRKFVLEEALKITRYHEENDIRSLYYKDEVYPHRLLNCDDGPLVLYTKGEADLNRTRFVAVVGTRACTEYGKEVTRQLISSFVDRDITVVSGLALGIDAWAHRYCLDFGVPTIAVLGHGLDTIYPQRNAGIARELLLKQGSIVSEFGPWTVPDKENFPKRNRIVAGMCDATVVVESKRTGGSMITARLANDYNRDVFALPGNITKETSLGCNELIAKNEAHLLSAPEDFFRIMGWNSTIAQPVQRKLFPELKMEQGQIVKLLTELGVTQIDRLSILSGIPISKLQAYLLELELLGVTISLPGNRVSMV